MLYYMGILQKIPIFLNILFLTNSKEIQELLIREAICPWTSFLFINADVFTNKKLMQSKGRNTFERSIIIQNYQKKHPHIYNHFICWNTCQC